MFQKKLNVFKKITFVIQLLQLIIFNLLLFLYLLLLDIQFVFDKFLINPHLL